MQRLKQFSALAVLSLFLGTHSYAGKLGDFEDDAKKREAKPQQTNGSKNERPSPPPKEERHDREDDERRRPRPVYYPDDRYPEQRYPGDIYEGRPHSHSDYVPTLDFNPFAPFIFGGQASLIRAAALGIQDKVPIQGNYFTTGKQWGEFIIPFFRLDLNQGWMGSGIEAKDYQVEIGYGPFAVLHKASFMQEDKSNDTLNSRQTLFLYRMSVSEQFQINLGMGEYTLAGTTQDTENAYTAGFNFHFSNNLGFEYRPMWVNGHTIKLTEHEVATFYGSRFVAAKLGYHWIISENDSLKGPFVGLSVAF